MKRDGHTHTEFCTHGHIDDVELLIQEAINQGFSHYSITEHAPLPKKFLQKAGGPAYPLETAGMSLDEMDEYIKKMHKLKKKYRSDIEIMVGLELDYLPSYEAWTRDFLKEYGEFLEDGVLSVHFLEGNGGPRAIDYTAEDYQEGIVMFYGSFQKAQEAYYNIVLQSIQADLGPYKPTRIGHISLCQKFQNFFKEDISFSDQSIEKIKEILDFVQEKGYELDYNTAGLFKEFCGETYPPASIIQEALKRNIPIVYGSDSHHIEDIGRGYEQVRESLPV